MSMASSTRDNFRANLKHYRKQKGLLQEKLSEIIGFGDTYITEIESRHKFPKPETIDLIAGKLGIEPFQLFVAPEQRDKDTEVTEQLVIKSIAEKMTARFCALLNDKMPEEVSDIMAQENLMLVQRFATAQ
ncbi:MAG: helix-turn-helix transcriptional regulator [Treponema sp.]|nr:helix-turn-helix transcriptional regulator [Treponema sp.]